MYSTGTALSVIATFLGPCQEGGLSQGVEQGRARIDSQRDSLLIDRESDWNKAIALRCFRGVGLGDSIPGCRHTDWRNDRCSRKAQSRDEASPI